MQTSKFMPEYICVIINELKLHKLYSKLDFD